MSINKVVIPIAGLGTRFLPITKVIPKEMLPINGKPILQILMEEALNSGIKEIILVINPEKEKIIKEYFSIKTQTSKKIAEKGKTENLKELNRLIKSVKIRYVFQKKQLGDGHAILQAKKYLKNTSFAVMFGDDIITTTKPNKAALAQLIDKFEETGTSIISLEKITPKQTESYGVPAIKQTTDKNLFEITDLVEKPKTEKAPSHFGIIGKYIITENAFKELKKIKTGSRGEIRLIDGLKQNLKNEKIHGLLIKGKRYDTGTVESYKKAVREI